MNSQSSLLINCNKVKWDKKSLKNYNCRSNGRDVKIEG